MKLSDYISKLKGKGYTKNKALDSCRAKISGKDNRVDWTPGMENVFEEIWEGNLPEKTKGTRWAIGDIHGCIKTLKSLVKKIKFNPSVDSLYFTGDYIDRGPDSKAVIDYVMALQLKSKKVFPLLGNHETMFISSISSTLDEQLWKQNGGSHSLKSFGVDTAKEIPAKYIQWIHHLKLYAQTPGYILSHAGLNLAHPEPFRNTDTNIDHILWNRDSGGYDPGKQIVLVVGHTPKNLSTIKQRLTSPKIFIDGGAVYGHNLVALNLEDKTLVVQSLQDTVETEEKE
jgi:serine/threonine protein phosphatase 1